MFLVLNVCSKYLSNIDDILFFFFIYKHNFTLQMRKGTVTIALKIKIITMNKVCISYKKLFLPKNNALNKKIISLQRYHKRKE